MSKIRAYGFQMDEPAADDRLKMTLHTSAHHRRRSVVLLCPGSGARAGGIGQFVVNLVAALARTEPDLILRVIDTRGAGHIAFAPLYFLRAMLQIARLGLRGDLALLHINLASRGSTLRKTVISELAQLLRVPTLIHLHGGQFDQFYARQPKLSQRVIRRMFRNAARVAVLSDNWRQFVIGLGVPCSKVEVIANGIPAPVPATRAEPAEVHLVFLGRLVDRKGVPELLRALAAPAVRGLSWHATLAGDGDQQPYRALARELGIGERVSFPGWLDRRSADALLAEASAFVLPSLIEAQPMSVIEALAYGVPVIASSVGAIPEFLRHGETALLVPPGEVEPLADALRELLQSPELRARLGENGRRLFAERFEITPVARRFADLYRELGSGARS